jgi:hypothetical protein
MDYLTRRNSSKILLLLLREADYENCHPKDKTIKELFF